MIFWIDDSNWTLVDQASYAYKTTFGGAAAQDDCNVDSSASPSTGEVGCSTRSIIDSNSNYNNIDLQFNPYGFDVSSVVMQNSPNTGNTTWLYTNNLDENSSMGVQFAGSVSAINKNEDVTNNFVNGCAAVDVDLDINITSDPELGSIIAFNTDDTNDTASVELNNIIMDANGTITDANGTTATILASGFQKDDNGSSDIDLRYNYDRINDMVTNPILATFHSLAASAPDANASAHLVYKKGS